MFNKQINKKYRKRKKKYIRREEKTECNWQIEIKEMMKKSTPSSICIKQWLVMTSIANLLTICPKYDVDDDDIHTAEQTHDTREFLCTKRNDNALFMVLKFEREHAGERKARQQQ